MTAAGVRDLSRVATARIVDVGDRVDPDFPAALLRERAEELARVVSAGGESWTEIAGRLEELRWSAVTELVIAWELELFGQREAGPARNAAALWAREEQTLYVATGESGPAWNAVARELVRAVWPDAPPANVALAIAGVLRAPDRPTAKRDLDDAGVPTLAAEVQAQVSAATAIAFDTADEEHPEPVNDAPEPFDAEPKPADGGDSGEMGEGPSAEGTDQQGDVSEQAGDERGEADWHDAGDDGASTGTDGGGGGTEPRAASRSATTRSTSSGSHLRSYVVPASPDGDSDSTGRESDGRIAAVDAAGIAGVLSYEREQGRTPEDMNETSPGNEGYDVRSYYDDGEIARWIEVKSTAGAWDRMGVSLSPAQFRFAQRDAAEQFWLYVVEFALDPEQRRVWCIQDPAERVTDFMFDDGWKGLAEPSGGYGAADSV